VFPPKGELGFLTPSRNNICRYGFGFVSFSGALPPRDADSDDESLADSVREDENTVTVIASPAHRAVVSPIQASKLRPVEENLDAVIVPPLPPEIMEEDVKYDSDGSWQNDQPVPPPISSSSQSRTVMVQLPTFHPRQLDLTTPIPSNDVDISTNAQEMSRVRALELSLVAGDLSDVVDIESVPMPRRASVPVDVSCETIDIATSREPIPDAAPMVLALNQCDEAVFGSPHKPALSVSSPQAHADLQAVAKDYDVDVELVAEAGIVTSRQPYDDQLMRHSRNNAFAALAVSSPQGRQSCQSEYSDEFSGSRAGTRSDGTSRSESAYSMVREVQDRRIVVRDQQCQTEGEERILVPRPTKQSSIPRLIRQPSSSSSVGSAHPETNASSRSSRLSLPTLPSATKLLRDENPKATIPNLRSSPIQMKCGWCLVHFQFWLCDCGTSCRCGCSR
jgi:hypothetical protein